MLKPVATGFDDARPENSDTARLLAAAGEAVTPETIARATPWRFRDAISPDMAAVREGRSIDPGALVEHCRAAMAGDHLTLIEGIGGVMVPLGPRETVRDLVAALAIPAVLVAGSYLGTLSHTLTAVRALAERHVPLAGIVVSESEASPVLVAETASALARHTAARVLTVPRLAPRARMWEAAPSLLELLPP
jgi:dethiobiotin synthetase